MESCKCWYCKNVDKPNPFESFGVGMGKISEIEANRGCINWKECRKGEQANVRKIMWKLWDS